MTGSADLPAARIAAETFRLHHPGALFVTLLVDGDRSDDVIVPADLGIGADALAVLATGHTAREACAALRPRLLEWLLGRHTCPVLYLDPWVRVFAPLAPTIGDAALVLVPKVLRPLPADGLRPSPDDLRAAGVYDEGFVAVAHGAEHFLHSWAEVSTRDPGAAGAFLDGAPALVDHVVLRDPGIGLSRWNAAQRALTKTADGTLTCGGAALRSVNFAGFDPTRPWLFSADIADHQRVLLSEHSLLNQLCADYADELDEAPAATIGFGRLADGTALPSPLRAAYRAAKDRPPAAGADPAGFLRWACAPDPDLPRWAVALWADDPNLRERFPDPADDGFRDWCATEGVLTGRLPQRAVPGHHDADVTLIDQIGVSVIGDGPLADRVRLAVGASGLPMSDQPVYPVVLTCDGTVPRQRHVIAVRADFGPVPAQVDERWLAWPAAAPAPDGIATHTVPLPVADPGAREEGARDEARVRLGLGDNRVFVAQADHADDLMAAFAAAFPTREDVRLALLVPESAARTEKAERLRVAAARDKRVLLVPDRHADAVDAADWAVSLHEPGCPSRVSSWLIAAGLRGVPLITVAGGVGAELLGTDGCVALPTDEFAADTMIAGAIRDLADDVANADKVGSAARTALLDSLGLAATGAAVRRRIELAYRGWRAARALSEATEDDPLRALRAARHALLRRPDADVGYKIPMAPQLRRAVLRVLAHYDSHLTSVLGSLIDGIERTAADLVERQEKLAGAGAAHDIDLLRADLDLMVERGAHLAKQVSATSDEVQRLRARPVQRAAAPSVDQDQLHALTESITAQLGAALAAGQARIDELEARLEQRLSERDSAVAVSTWSAEEALRSADALRRVVVRQHERVIPAELSEVPSALVLCDAGLLRLPADDAVMSAVLSSKGVWEPEVAELVDALIEPDSVFLDVGAYVGYHAVRVLSRLGASGTVVAVEPAAEAAKLLRHNVSANVGPGVAERLAVLEVAAWDKQVALVGRQAAGGGVAVAPQDQETVITTTSGELALTGVRLDRELESLAAVGDQRLSVVKVDVPGRGHRALGGLVRRLRKDRPHVIFAIDGPLTSEFGDDPGVVLREFRTWGYELVRLGDDTPVEVGDVVEEVLAGQVRTLWLRPPASR